jgi:hypothetical protein
LAFSSNCMFWEGAAMVTKVSRALLLCLALGVLVWVVCVTYPVGPLDAHCPPDPPTSTPWPVQPTYTPRPTYTPNAPVDTPTPTCQATATLIVRFSPTPYPTSTLYPTSTPYPISTPGIVIWFEESFEDLTEAPRGGPCADTPDCYGSFDYVEQGMGCPNYHPSLNVIELDHNIVHSGQTSLRFEMNRQAPIAYEERRINVGIGWDKHIPLNETWVSFWIYLPEDFTAPSWVNILDFRQSGGGKWYVYLKDRTGGMYATFSHLWWNRPTGAIDPPSVRASHPLPRARWVRLQVYYRRGWDDGQIILWHDTDDAGPDTEVLNVSGFTSYAPEYNMIIHWRYYSHYGPNVLFWDDFVVADRWVERGYVPD